MTFEAVLAGSPLSVLDPQQFMLLGSLLFWGSLGVCWRWIEVRRWLVLGHAGAALTAFFSVPEYRDWDRFATAPSSYHVSFLIVLIIHVTALTAACFYRPGRHTAVATETG